MFSVLIKKLSAIRKSEHSFFENLCFFIISFLIICPTVGVIVTGRSFYPFFNYYMYSKAIK
ncbi:MAG: hypothetical protein OXN83_06085, partial [Oligoflexia bacterium]|nr:hypothetical protein [Oligoflexia bacterium]